MATQSKFTKGSIKVLNGTGHATLEYDLETGEGVKEAQASIRGYKAVFDAGTREQIHDPKLGTHEEMLVVPPMAGGR